ncbi:MAG: hypothetical protein A2487_13520 [Candidatus Raymondbacteria bacterium RifOxyC12_full_50_8]|uniref:Uncharacterized protein n=1 Tax=Candidatus Raymondbacteria bacterium RIFOXYD12_FULL_49_13 TaxID=1817890 RepID=A0A1F7F875_UNCRA|nr:MAG: hypothetical protein A2248_13630 [Candidatus Raymondbacteria bacterium RIFOXYA2_FULL_49_16]OGJ95166.1 MAG: hypothetical protein A2350_09485 [Candidatus Raymondbacteria bacterium RifOxyB12_full_50_8]OGK00378.1 MAG: hypothetical protein A2487_13520 [Candidatus Raymondbacteria bacterium RifOxyC12_full_50_8]OGK02706.1 MAG: hypothetical protein A2519_09595 [Candidatus Raymondbacteria bacterium RIFOXYD12_FULL_49_13]OGP42352.1 MAG: hypothetical protein A2324_20265 [Candidatus Raymondbacteria b
MEERYKNQKIAYDEKALVFTTKIGTKEFTSPSLQKIKRLITKVIKTPIPPVPVFVGDRYEANFEEACIVGVEFSYSGTTMRLTNSDGRTLSSDDEIYSRNAENEAAWRQIIELQKTKKKCEREISRLIDDIPMIEADEILSSLLKESESSKTE